MGKIVLVIISGLFLSGCVGTLGYLKGASYVMKDQAHQGSYDSSLEGRTKQDIRAMLGNPDSKKTSYSYNNRIDFWHYYFKNREDIGSLHIVFIDGLVNSASRN